MDIEPDELEAFFARYTKRQYEKGDTIIAGGEEPPGVFYVKSGQVKKYTISSASGNSYTLHLYNTKSYFPVTWAIVGINNRHFYEATTSTLLYRAPRDEFLKFIRTRPQILYELAQRVLSATDALLTRLESMTFSDVTSRLITELLFLANQSGRKNNSGNLIVGHYTHQELAGSIGIARETVSLTLKKLERENLITCAHHIIQIPDPVALQRRARQK